MFKSKKEIIYTPVNSSLYTVVACLYESSSGSIISVGEERANLSAVVYL